MKSILLLGAGRSANVLISYLDNRSIELGFKFTVADQSVILIKEKTSNLKNGVGVRIEVSQKNELFKLIENHDLIVSLLPPFMHVEVAKMCLNASKHLITASYINDEMRSLDTEAKAKGLLFLNECGLDPGIDHMSAMEIIDEITSEGGLIHTFKSWCGGLVAPESDNNPWGYKISWNPWNVVQAGKGVSRFRQEGKIKLLPYHQLFRSAEAIDIPGLGLNLEGYPNRDSLMYDNVYGLENAKTIIRGTLRKRGFCRAWSAIVQLGLTDDTVPLNLSGIDNWPQWLSTFLPELQDLQFAVKNLLPELDEDAMQKLIWLGLFDKNNRIDFNGNAVAGVVLQQLLEKKWVLESDDKDMIVMLHEFGFTNSEGENVKFNASLMVKGTDNLNTAMATTVGLPLGIAAINVINGSINEKGVCLPSKRTFYKPILSELSKFGVVFHKSSLQNTF